ncbi:MAG TPA: formate dehydrogenase accessory sulfurtransferase FdhD [Candidatus Limnocylindrales bacterium]|nr:formate dehydrogenase accessory sulfurtransferase FdhD [Candidatus Limnocylindrales bacterium]
MQPSGAPPTPREAAPARVLAIRDGAVEERADRLAGEEPMAIRVAGPGQEPIDVAVTMRTPGGEDELALGFLHSEGLIAPDDVVAVERGDPASLNQPDDEVLVRLRRPFDPAVVPARHFVATASCGICGKASIDEVAVRSAPIPVGSVVAPEVLYGLPDALRAAQSVFEATGGLHASGLFDLDGRLLRLREDVGRHNALDKLIGASLLAGELPLHDRIVLVSGRVAFEIVQKAATAAVPILAAVGAPSDLAVETADRLGVTLVGFLRGRSCNVYAHPERVAVGG